ncbi:Homeobox domain-like [Trinorchestia longiramus]|nr:Homeobox domain-like [Trinorchestia longiramus]
MNRSTVWKIVKKFKEIGTTSDKPGRGRKRSVQAKTLLKNTREKLRRNPHRSHRKLAAEAGLSKTQMYRVLKENLGKKPYKMMKCHEFPEHRERMRAKRSCHILNDIAQGTFPNLVFTDKKK